MLATLVSDNNLALLLITHNLALLRLLVDHIVVMFAGTIVEQGPTTSVMNSALTHRHPYTQDLLRAVAPPGIQASQARSTTPTARNMTINRHGCRYFHRCQLKERLPEATRLRCRQEMPQAWPVDTDHTVACWAYEGTS